MGNTSSNEPAAEGACDLESVIVTHELSLRESRRSNAAAEDRAVLVLVSELSKAPHNFFQKLVDTALFLSVADSTGISLLNEDRKRFVWPAVAGGLTPYLGGGTPQDFGPCGTVLERNAPLLFRHPERHFGYLTPIEPPLEEVLLIPFHINGKAVGTIWAVIHVKDRHFDGEDKRLLENLSQFAASAYRVLAKAGAIDPLLNLQPAATPSELASKT
jgi:GAF domain-containing protein